MTLKEFVAACDGGDVLFAAREIVTENDQNKEQLIVSFNKSEADAIKSEITSRTVKKFRAEIETSANAISGRTHTLTMAVVLNPADTVDTGNAANGPGSTNDPGNTTNDSTPPNSGT